MAPQLHSVCLARTARHLARVTAVGLAGALLIGSLPAATATDDKLPAGRRLKTYTVRSGDTATELAVRFHAWTDELIRFNHLGPNATMYVGQRLRIPVVIAATRHHHKHAATEHATKKHATKTHRKHQNKKHTTGWRHADPSRERVRRIIVRTSHRYGVDPELALAISWQEAGWQMHHVSSAEAIGAMQILPGTGEWMSLYAGRPLRLYDVHDNVLAGVLMIKVLGRMTSSRRAQIGAYYQGPGAVQRHGLYPATKRYVANVRAIKRSLERGHSPA